MSRISDFGFRIFKNKKGYTLIELLMYMGVFLILLLVFFQILGSVLDAQLESESASAIEQDSKFILGKLTYDIQQAQTINTPSQPGTQNTNMQLTINSTLYTYAVTSGNLQLTNNNGTDNLNSYTTSVSNFTINRIGNQGGKNSLSISFTLTSKITRNAGTDTKTYQTTIATR